MDNQLICRACLRIVENRTQSFGYIEDASGNLKDMIMCCVPEMDIYVSPNPIICFPCIQLLIMVYNFKTRCLNTETIIRSYIQRNNLVDYNQVNLNCVIQELIKLNQYFRDVQHRITNDCKQQNFGSREANLNTTVENQAKSGSDTAEQKNHMPQVPVLNIVLSPNPDMGSNYPESDTILRHKAMAQHQKMLQGLPLNPDLSEPQILLNDTNKDMESEHLQNDHAETGSNTAKNVESDTLQAHINNNNNKDVDENGKRLVSVDEKESKVENRPKLIIKISKSKIILPPTIREDLNEKENMEMDVDIKNTETPGPESTPLETSECQENRQDIYQCINCTFLTTNVNYYLAHQNMCTNDMFEKKCPHCPHVTNRQYALNKHINTMHTKSTWYCCDFCLYRSTDSSSLRRHKRNVHPERKGDLLKCHLCSYVCTSQFQLKKHSMKHEENSVLQCPFCSYSTKDRSNFRKHVFIHNPRRQGCEFCDYKCVSPYQMKLHLKKLHNGVGMEDVNCRSEVSISEVVQDITAAIRAAKDEVEPQTN